MQSSFPLCSSSDNHLSRKHLFTTLSVTAYVGYWSNVELNRYDCIRFLFLFRDFILNYVYLK